MNAIIAGAEPFFLPANPAGDLASSNTGVLLVHGYTGTPFEMRWLGEQLAGSGCTVLGIRLFGHATRQEDMIRARWEDWSANLEDGFNLLKQSCEHLFVGGLSMGGALSLHSAAELPWHGAFSMSAPFFSPDRRLSTLRPILPMVSRFWRFAAKSGHSDWADQSLERDHIEYPSYPVRSGVELDRLLEQMREDLTRMQIPLLVMHSMSDRVVPHQHAQQIIDAASTTDKRMVLLEKSGHGITRDIEKGQVLEEILAFLSHCIKGGAA